MLQTSIIEAIRTKGGRNLGGHMASLSDTHQPQDSQLPLSCALRKSCSDPPKQG